MSCDEIRDVYLAQNLTIQLLAQGYDIITYNIYKCQAFLPIEKNAEAFEQFINHINSIKTSNEELVVLGASMGGLIAKKALVDMENSGQKHQCRMYISLDTPHKGANAPLGLQQFLGKISFTSIFNADFSYLFSALTSYSAGQMLHLSNNTKINLGKIPVPWSEHTSFYNTLNSANQYKGYPTECIRIGISDGSFKGRNRTCPFELESSGYQLGTGGQYMPGGLGIKINAPLGVNYLLRTMGDFDCYDGLLDIPLVESNAFSTLPFKYLDMPYDNCPGGNYPWFNQVEENLPSGFSADVYIPNSNFIHTKSALDIALPSISRDLTSLGKNTVLSKTPFDDIWWDANQTNLRHATMSSEMGKWLFDKITGLEKFKTLNYNLNIDAKTYASGSKEVLKARNNINFVNSYFNAGSQIKVIAGYNINLKNTKITAGSTVKIVASVNTELPKQNLNYDYEIPTLRIINDKANNQPFTFQVTNPASFESFNKYDWSIRGVGITDTEVLYPLNMNNISLIRNTGTHYIDCKPKLDGYVPSNTTGSFPFQVSNNIIGNEVINLYKFNLCVVPPQWVYRAQGASNVSNTDFIYTHYIVTPNPYNRSQPYLLVYSSELTLYDNVLQTGDYYIHSVTAFPLGQLFEVNYKKITINRNNLIGCGIFRKEAQDSLLNQQEKFVDLSNNITIFPNPTTSKVHLTTGFDGESEIVLTDIAGKTLQTYTTTSNETDIDLSAYYNGMYFFKITNRLGKHIAKVMKIVDN